LLCGAYEGIRWEHTWRQAPRLLFTEGVTPLGRNFLLDLLGDSLRIRA